MSEPYYRQIIADVRRRIVADEWRAGDQLPSTQDLVDFYREKLGAPKLTRATVRQAITLLIELEELRGQQGVGVFVASRQPD